MLLSWAFQDLFFYVEIPSFFNRQSPAMFDWLCIKYIIKLLEKN